MAGSRLLSPLGPLVAGGGVEPRAPVISSPLFVNSVVDRPFSYSIRARYRPTSFDAVGLPPGLSVDQTNGRISGTPNTIAVTNVTISATNAEGSDTQTLEINITAMPVPVITSTTARSVRVGVPFNYTITATNNPTSFAATGLPAGFVLTGAVITGTPTAALIGGHDVVLTATNAGGTSAPRTLRITVTAVPTAGAPVITSKLTAYGTEQSFSYQITATNNPDSFDATNLPAGFAVTPAGLITGTPPIASGGPYNVTITATNTAGTGSAVLVIEILDTSAMAHYSNSASPPGPGVPGELWMRSNTNSLAHWSPIVNNWFQLRGSPS